MKTTRTRAAAGIAGALAVATALPGAAGAQEQVPVETLDTVVVTTKRYPALRTELPQKIEVISGRDLERTPAVELTDVLKKQAGLDVVQYPGLLSGIGIRGFRPEFSGTNKRTLLLIDGRPAGATNLATIDLGSLERIEVLKGPASSLYGSSAMGGAVNLVTRRSDGAPGGSASLAYGSWETLDLSARAGGSFTRWLDADFGLSRFSRGADYRAGEGNLFRDWVGSTEAVKLIGGDRERVPERGDGEVRPNTRYTYGSGNGRLGFRLGDALRLDVRGEAFFADDVETPGDLYVDGDPGQLKNLDRRSGDVSLSGAFGRHAPMLRVYAGRELTDYFDTWASEPYVSYTSETETRGAQLQDAVRFGRQALTFGVDFSQAGETSRVFTGEAQPGAPYSPDATTRSTAVFAEGRFELPGTRLSGTLGGRLDRVGLEIENTPLRPDWQPAEETFTVFNPSVGLQYATAQGVRVHGTAGRAFVAPTVFGKAGLSVQRSATTGVATIAVGNPELDPESSVTWDVGVGIERPRLGLDADVTYFRTRVTDRITSVAASFPEGSRPRTAAGDPVGSVSTYVNADEARMDGVEWRLGWDLGAFARRRYSLRLFANATHYLEREETARSVQVDAARFAGRTDFRPEEVAGALVFGEGTESRIRNVADATVAYGVEWDDLRRFSTRLTGRYVGERTDQDFTDFSRVSDIEYPAFMTLDLVSTVRLADRYAVSLLVDNLTDENYYEKRGFNMPGRTMSLRLTADF